MSDRKPNILFMLNDHQAYYRHGWDGGLGPARPHFDRLAREGVDFDRAYADLYQLNNLINGPGHQAIAAELDQRPEAWRRQTGDTALIRQR